MKEERCEKLDINWKYFSLEQVNSQQGPEWKIWKQSEDYPSRGLVAFQAAEAARRQGEIAFNRFHYTLLNARHRQRQNIAEKNTLIEVARSVGLEMVQFEKDLGDRTLLNRLTEDHTFAVETLGVFGTPTLVFPERQAVFLKLESPPPLGECSSVFNEVRHLVEYRPYIMEIKRP